MYLELLKCLNLYSQQIIDRSELLTLVHDLFKRTQIELFSHSRRLPGYSGGDARDAPSRFTSAVNSGSCQSSTPAATATRSISM